MSTKKELEGELDKIEKKLNVLLNDFVNIKKNIKSIHKQVRTKKDNKIILDLKKKIASL